MARPGAAFAENFGDLLDPRFKKIFDEEYKVRDQSELIGRLYSMESTSKNYEKLSGVGGLGDVGIFDGSLDYDSQSQLYDTTATFPERALGMKIQRKLYDDDLTRIMDGKPRQLAISAARTQEENGSSTF